MTKVKYGIAAAALAALMTAGFAGTALSAAKDSGISMTEARRIARNYLRSIGTTAPLRSQSTATVGAAELINDKYHVTVKLGIGSPIPTRQETILVDRETGEVEAF